MYTGINLTITSAQLAAIAGTPPGRVTVAPKIRRALAEHLSGETLDASSIVDDWFPAVAADLFISHSHADADLAGRLADFIAHEFGLRAFIDSEVWGHADELLKDIDNRFSRQPDGTYCYNRRNRTTAHVHMMLNVALQEMMDRAECVVFLNTKNSVEYSGDIVGKSAEAAVTYSPWLYSELAMTKTLRRSKPRRDSKRFIKESSRVLKDTVGVAYQADLSDLNPATAWHLSKWAERRAQEEEGHPLDLLYRVLRPLDEMSEAIEAIVDRVISRLKASDGT